jgi:hypothetical protein
MNIIKHSRLLVAVALAASLLGSFDLLAQNNGGGGNGGGGRRGNRNAGGNQGNFDPAQFQARRLQRYREQLEVTDDTEWKAIQPLVEKVMQAEAENRVGGFGGGRNAAQGRRGQPDAAANPAPNANRARRGGAEPNPAATALQAALDSKATPEEVKAKLAKLREAVAEKEANLAKAREALRQVLSVRQEAIAVLNGLLR